MRNVLLGIVVVVSAWAVAQPAMATSSREEVTARRLLEEARDKAKTGNDEGALRDLEMVAEQFPGTDAATEALLDRARISWERDEPFAAEQILDRLIERAPRSPYSASAYVQKSRIASDRAESRSDLEKALVPLRRVPLLFDRQTHPFLEARAESRFEEGELLIRLGQTAAAGAAFLDILELEPHNDWKAAAAVRLGEVLAWRGDWQAAATLFQEVSEGVYPGPEPWREVALRRLELLSRMRVWTPGKTIPWMAARRIPVPGGLKKAVGVAVDDEGRLLIADEGSPALIVMGVDGQNEIRSEVKKIGKPWWDPDGGAYFTTPDQIFIPFERARRPYSERDQKNRQVDLKKLVAGAHGVYGDLFLLDSSPSRVLRFAANRRFLGATVPREQDPVDLASDPRGGLLVLFDGGYVIRFDGDGQRLGKVAGGPLKKPLAVTVDRLGDIYILDGGQKKIEIYSSDGQRLGSVGPTLPGGLELSSPRDIAIDGRGRLFIADAKASLIVLEGGI